MMCNKRFEQNMEIESGKKVADYKDQSMVFWLSCIKYMKCGLLW